MVTKVIKTQDDYVSALDRINALMDAQPGSDDFDELELLSTLVELFEEKVYPIDQPDPVNAILFRMEQLGLQQKDLIPYIGSKSKVSEVLNRKKTLSLAMIRALHKGLEIPTDILLQEPVDQLPEDFQDLDFKRFPLKEMVAKQWIDPVPDIYDHAEEIIRKLIGSAGGMNTLKYCLFRRTRIDRNNEKNDTYALMAWCLKVMQTAKEHTGRTNYSKSQVNTGFLKKVAQLSYFSNGPLLAVEYLEKHGISLIIQPHLKRTYLDGSVFFSQSENPVIGLTLRYDRIDNFWFCLLHELAHLVLHADETTDIAIIDDLDMRKTEPEEDNIEKQADTLAQESLIPSESWDQFFNVEDELPSVKEVAEFADSLQIHPAIVAGRLRYETGSYRKYSGTLGQGTVRALFTHN